jgi:prepilin-type N-terminal cleavage/methylation domain-containing protein
MGGAFMNKKGFTLIEMLIVTSVLSALVLMFAPDTFRILNKGSAAKTSADLKSIANVMFQHSIEHQALPLGVAITTTDSVVAAGIKDKLKEIGLKDVNSGSTPATVDADYTAISSHFKAIDNTKITAYSHDKYDDYFIIDDSSPKMAGYIVSNKKMNAVNQTGQAIQFVEPSGIFSTATASGTTFSFNTIKTLSSGGYHTLAIKQDGSLWGWGNNVYGQLALDDTVNRLVPTRIGIENTWSFISASYTSTFAIKQDGSLWGWGRNNIGQLGLNDTVNRLVPTRIGISNAWTSASSRGTHTIAIQQDGSLWGWGYNIDGELGLNDTVDRLVPTRIGTSNTWTSASAGGDQSLAIQQDGSLWSWGYNGYGPLGLNDTVNRLVPTRVGTGNTWSFVSTGYSHTLAIQQDGSLWGWGSNVYGQLGLNDTVNRLVPTRIGTSNTWASVAAGGDHTLAIQQDGSLWNWGLNDGGQLAFNDTVNRFVPTRVGIENTWSTRLSGGGFYTLAIKQDGSLWGWGRNDSGQLGLNDTIDRYVSIRVGTEIDWK